jgi:hypothetical protein
VALVGSLAADVDGTTMNNDRSRAEAI